jgi:hypothetical protein
MRRRSRQADTRLCAALSQYSGGLPGWPLARAGACSQLGYLHVVTVAACSVIVVLLSLRVLITSL